MRIKALLFFVALLALAGWGPSSYFAANSDAVGSQRWMDHEVKVIGRQADNLNPEVLKIGLEAYSKARQQGIDSNQLLTIVDYSKPSIERRLWVVDLKSEKVLFNTYVAHGKNSGEVNSTEFSNDFHSLKSSIGVFRTVEAYVGHDGYSLRVQGLEHGINDHALQRNVVFHGAAYVSEEVAKTHNRLGRSWGCFAVGEKVVKPLINTIKNDTVVVAYYPDQNWLKHSAYLKTDLA